MLDRDRIRFAPVRMRGLAKTALLWSAVLLGHAGLASSASIFPSASPDYYECRVTLNVGIPAHFYVLASGYPSPSTDPEIVVQGITSAEFRITGLPDQVLIVAAEPGSGGTIEGDPFGAGGRVSFPECRPWESPSCLVPLLDVTVFPIAPVPEGTISLHASSSSCLESIDATFLGLCDAPAATQLCAPASGICFNETFYCTYCPVSSPSRTCTLPVTPATWSTVKALFH